MIADKVRASPIISEFTPEEINRYFDLRKEATESHVDSLYFCVSILNDKVVPDECPVGINLMLSKFKELRTRKTAKMSDVVSYAGLSFELTRFVHYEYCLRKAENFDIFFSSLLPNKDTPRIVVQIRTRMLVLDGVCKSICKAFRYVENILDEFGLNVGTVFENRIDYSYHTSLIQNPYKYFSDDLLLSKLKSKMRLYHKVGEIGKSIDIDYISFGQRKSNNVFVRIYNKSREVVEKNYKSFFFQKWLDQKLINEYDFYVYQKAYEMKSYVTGILVGRIDWYLEYGHNDAIKKELLRVKKSCYVNSDNVDQLRKIVDNYLPPVTLIMNIEFQTKRKFYKSIDPWIEIYKKAYLKNGKIEGFYDTDKNPLFRLFSIYSLRSEICNYLTTQTLSFVDNKGTKNEKLCRWWQRINDCYIEEYDKRIIDLWRTYERNADIEKGKRRVYKTIASLNIIQNSGYIESTFMEDVSDLLCILNDNDVSAAFVNTDTGELFDFNPDCYQDAKIRSDRQYRSVFGKRNKDNLVKKKGS